MQLSAWHGCIVIIHGVLVGMRAFEQVIGVEVNIPFAQFSCVVGVCRVIPTCMYLFCCSKVYPVGFFIVTSGDGLPDEFLSAFPIPVSGI